MSSLSKNYNFLASEFKTLVKGYDIDSSQVQFLWNEITLNHLSSDRYYHNLNHLQDLFQQLSIVKNKIENWQVILFTLYYHDIIYDATKNNNEERSAEFATKRMTEIGVKQTDINLCFEQIIATKKHHASNNMDTNYFTDADLSILGRKSEVFDRYNEQIRKEYNIYPDTIYNNGRKQVVQHFLSMKTIYKTGEFYDKYETQARYNLENELKFLNSIFSK